MNGGDEAFPSALDQWMPEDWQEYRRRIEDGEVSVRAMDVITRRRTRTIVCRDEDGRFLVHCRPDDSSRFPGQYNWMLGGAADVGESYEEAAARELSEELGVHAAPRFVLKFLCAGAIWLGLHEVVITASVQPSVQEVAWHDWLTEPELESLVRQQRFVPDAREAFDRYRDLRRADRPLS